METLLGVSAKEIRDLNRSFGGATEMNGTVETAFATANYHGGFWAKVACVVRSIAAGHLFDNGNKRTALAAVRLFQRRNHIFTGTPDHMLKATITKVATKQIMGIADIAEALRNG